MNSSAWAGNKIQGTTNYRLTSRATAGIFYSFSTYVYQHGQGISDTQSVGGLYSYAFNRSTRVQLRAGGGPTDTTALQAVPLNPLAAALFGFPTEIIEARNNTFAEDVSAQIARDFRNRETVSVSYSKGVSPGNGLLLTAMSQTINVAASLKLFGRYLTSVAMGQQRLTSTGGAAENYVTDYFHIGSSRSLTQAISLTFSADYRYFQVSAAPGLRNQIALNCGVTFGRTEDKLWPLW